MVSAQPIRTSQRLVLASLVLLTPASPDRLVAEHPSQTDRLAITRPSGGSVRVSPGPARARRADAMRVAVGSGANGDFSLVPEGDGPSDPSDATDQSPSTNGQEPQPRATSTADLAGVRLCRQVALPESDARLGGRTVNLGRPTSNGDKQLLLQLDSSAALLDDECIGLGRPIQTGKTRSWPIQWTRTAPPRPTGLPSGRRMGLADELAILHSDDGQLTLVCREHAPAAGLAALSNCQLVVHPGTDVAQAIQFRMAQPLPPLSVSFEQGEATWPISIVDPPHPDRVGLQLDPSQHLSPGLQPVASERDDSAPTLVCVRFADWQDAEVQVRLRYRSSKFEVEIRLRYRHNRKLYPLVPSELSKQLTLRTRQFAENNRNVSAAKTRLKQIPSDVRRIRKERPRSIPERSWQAIRLSRLEKEYRSLTSRVRRLDKASPELQQSIERLSKLSEVLTQLGPGVSVPIQLVAKTDHGVIRLTRSTSSP